MGLASNAALKLLDFGFNALRMHRIYATCDPRNTGSARVLQKIGMKEEGRIREDLWIKTEWRDSLLFGLLAHEYHQSLSSNKMDNEQS